jgi:alkanesulfonate monooxygenase SsuD/methylene tetrahydromethanopterin reductase-like flavin-dependent oxidoreductase (luciferase family)
VIVGGGGGARRTPRLAARFADEFNMPFASLAATARQFARVRAACEAAGRDPAGSA